METQVKKATTGAKQPKKGRGSKITGVAADYADFLYACECLGRITDIDAMQAFMPPRLDSIDDAEKALRTLKLWIKKAKEKLPCSDGS
jgi:hypothetical protein